MLKTTLVVVIDHTKPIPDLLKLVEGRIYNLDKVENVEAAEVVYDDVLHSFSANLVQPA